VITPPLPAAHVQQDFRLKILGFPGISKEIQQLDFPEIPGLDFPEIHQLHGQISRQCDMFRQVLILRHLSKLLRLSSMIEQTHVISHQIVNILHQQLKNPIHPEHW